MQINITLPDVVEFRRGGHEVALDITGLSPDMIAELIAHGLTQKVGDAAAGKSGDDAQAAMLKVWDALQAGNWGVRRATGGPGLTDEQTAIVAVADSLIAPKAWKEKIADWADMTTKQRRVAKWAILAEHPMLEELRAEAARRVAPVKLKL
jgi:hypothetical protein